MCMYICKYLHTHTEKERYLGEHQRKKCYRSRKRLSGPSIHDHLQRHFIKKEQNAPKCQSTNRRSLSKFAGLSNNRKVGYKFIYKVENKQVSTA